MLPTSRAPLDHPQSTRAIDAIQPKGAPTNKGAEIAVSLDWLSVTFRGIAPEEIAKELGGLVPSTWRPAGGGFGYVSAFRGAAGSAIYFTPGRDDCHASLPGRWCGSLARPAARRLLGFVDAAGGNPTRCDLAATDRGRLVEPWQVAAAIERGEHVTHARCIHYDRGLADSPGATVYVGANSSRQQLLVYDKTAESEGRVEGVRWELRTRDVAAASLTEQLRLAQNWRDLWARRVVGFIDFREAHGERSTWFNRLVGDVGKEGAYRPVPVRSLDDAERWLERQVAPTLSAVVAARGGDLSTVTDLLAQGRSRWGPQHLALIEQGGIP